MAQIFHPSTNTIAKASIFGAVFFVAAAGWIGYEINRSDHVTQRFMVRPQPVEFSHEHHVSGLGIHCLYCHTSVEESDFANIPPTKTCMTCHSVIWTNAAMLEPVRQSWNTNRPLRWTRVNDLADFCYFNHEIHVQKGIGCSTCHGPVHQMPLVWQTASLQMEWCLQCHREPERFIRPREEIYDMDWQPPPDQIDRGRELVKRYHVRTKQLTDCSVCHR